MVLGNGLVIVRTLVLSFSSRLCLSLVLCLSLAITSAAQSESQAAGSPRRAVVGGLTQEQDGPAVASEALRERLKKAQRILFLGDSITYQGDYLVLLEAWCSRQPISSNAVFLNLGLPSETVSGLSEDGHAGGKFPRPDLAERLERVLETTQADFVFACYGMNCGIQMPLDASRFARFQQGIENLHQATQAREITLVLLTPPIFDGAQSKLDFSYDHVLQSYAQWLVAQRERGWTVLDLHTAMSLRLQKAKNADPQFTVQPDAVHPNQTGHFWIAATLLQFFGEARVDQWQSSDVATESLHISEREMQCIRTRQILRRDAYLTAAGHKRPGLSPGKSVAAAEQEADPITTELKRIRSQNHD